MTEAALLRASRMRLARRDVRSEAGVPICAYFMRAQILLHRLLNVCECNGIRKCITSNAANRWRLNFDERTPLKKIVKAMKRSEGSLRQKAMALGIGLGHRR